MSVLPLLVVWASSYLLGPTLHSLFIWKVSDDGIHFSLSHPHSQISGNSGMGSTWDLIPSNRITFAIYLTMNERFTLQWLRPIGSFHFLSYSSPYEWNVFVIIGQIVLFILESKQWPDTLCLSTFPWCTCVSHSQLPLRRKIVGYTQLLMRGKFKLMRKMASPSYHCVWLTNYRPLILLIR